ncbi:hypothetical protein V502_08395 [Pseudogymnoascus sp. VKM F-4520 (FW-2644)]|nr:hypothetical protein V502_08395 [Pseudogymnoascus sp. VKM F-4520 (FW-2644)]
MQDMVREFPVRPRGLKLIRVEIHADPHRDVSQPVKLAMEKPVGPFERPCLVGGEEEGLAVVCERRAGGGHGHCGVVVFGRRRPFGAHIDGLGVADYDGAVELVGCGTRPGGAHAGGGGLEEGRDGLEGFEVVACEGELGEDEEVEVLGGGIGEDVVGEGDVVLDLADLGCELQAADTHLGGGGGVSRGRNKLSDARHFVEGAPVDRTQGFVGGNE